MKHLRIPRIPGFASRRFHVIGAFAIAALLLATDLVSAGQVKLMTYNIQQKVGNTYGYQGTDGQKIARIIVAMRPDILTINELECSDITAAQTTLTNWVNTYMSSWFGSNPGIGLPGRETPGHSYYVYVSTLTDGYIRNAIVSRYPLLAAASQSLSPRGLDSATVDLNSDGVANPITDIRVYTAHFKADSDSSSASTRQNDASTFVTRVGQWIAANPGYSYTLSGDLNEDESNPQTPLTGTYHPITTVLTAGLQNVIPQDPFQGSSSKITKTISSSSPTRRFDYTLPSNGLIWLGGQIIDSVTWYDSSFNTFPAGMNRTDSLGSDHLSVISTFQTPDTTFNIAGQANLGAYFGNISLIPFTIQLAKIPYDGTITTRTIYPDTNGSFVIPSVSPGSWEIGIKPSHWLQQVIGNITVSTGDVGIGTVAFRNGDADNNNRVNAADYSRLVTAMGSTTGSAHWDPMVDFDGNGRINANDYSILAGNMGQVGSTLP